MIEVMKMIHPLKKVRENVGLSQEALALSLGIPVKTIRNWEQNIRKPSEWTIDLLIDRILREKTEQNQSNNEHSGLVSFLTMKKKISVIAEKFDVDRIYLFGSYAKGEATEISDIDLYMESELFGLDYFEFIEMLREELHKNIELLSNKTVEASSSIEQEIKKTGVLIYER